MRKEKILIVDDSEMNRSILADMLSDRYEIIEAEDGLQAVAIMQKRLSELSLMLLDIVMPAMDGFGVLKTMRKNHWIEDVPVIIISAENSSEQVERAYELGAADFIARPFDTLMVQRRVVNTLLLYAKQKQLIGIVEEQIYEKERYSDLMIDILSHIVEFRNGESGLHILHVRTLTDLLLSYLIDKTDQYHLSVDDISIISTASALHDIGKIAIDEHILNKPGKLTPEEFELMKTHAAVGAEMLSNLPFHRDEPLVRVACEICRWHHERWDGRGYPDGLRGDDIPICAQVVALADVYDALTSERVYKPPFSHEKATAMISGGECGAFNPLLLECLVENAGQVRKALTADSISEARSKKIQIITSETMKKIGGGASERTLRLLDKERIRNSFYASMTETIQFEYTASPQMVTLSAWGAEKLGLKEIIMNPAQDAALRALLGEETWDRLVKKILATTPAQPLVRMECLFHGETPRWYRVVLQTLWKNDGTPQIEGALGILVDIHDAHLKMEELAQKASRDLMTGLLNRNSAKEQIELRMREHPKGLFALAIFDVDNLKTANDTYGHQFGDQLLKYVVENLRGSIRGTDISCRAGGDEFMIFLEYRTDIEKTINRIFNHLCGQIGSFQVSVSMGIALASSVGLSYEKMFSAADAALYAAKQLGKRQYCFYDPSMKDTLRDVYSTVTDVEPREE